MTPRRGPGPKLICDIVHHILDQESGCNIQDCIAGIGIVSVVTRLPVIWHLAIQ